MVLLSVVFHLLRSLLKQAAKHFQTPAAISEYTEISINLATLQTGFSARSVVNAWLWFKVGYTRL